MKSISVTLSVSSDITDVTEATRGLIISLLRPRFTPGHTKAAGFISGSATGIEVRFLHQSPLLIQCGLRYFTTFSARRTQLLLLLLLRFIAGYCCQ